jgi:ligand-binding SRPBCC domain-containing protein
VPFHFETEQWVPYPVERVFRFFANPGNLPRIMPPSTGTELVELKLIPPPDAPAGAAVTNQPALAGIGSEIVTSFRIFPLGPFRARWIALITEFEWNHHFADIQKSGPMKSFHHRHELRGEMRSGMAGTVVHDRIEYEIGFGLLGRIAQKLFLARQLKKAFAYRQQVLPRLLSTT